MMHVKDKMLYAVFGAASGAGGLAAAGCSGRGCSACYGCVGGGALIIMLAVVKQARKTLRGGSNDGMVKVGH